MKTIFYATTNQGKIHSLNMDLQSLDIKVEQANIDLPEPRSYDVVEIAKHKVLYAYKKIKKPVVTLDSGFYIPSLNGFPRAFVNFALETIENWGILKLVKGLDRSCEFRECLAYLTPEMEEPEYFSFAIKGTLAEKERGTKKDYHWSTLALIFIPEGYDKTLAEMEKEEYIEWRRESHGNGAGKQFAKWLGNQ